MIGPIYHSVRLLVESETQATRCHFVVTLANLHVYETTVFGCFLWRRRGKNGLLADGSCVRLEKRVQGLRPHLDVPSVARGAQQVNRFSRGRAQQRRTCGSLDFLALKLGRIVVVAKQLGHLARRTVLAEVLFLVLPAAIKRAFACAAPPGSKARGAMVKLVVVAQVYVTEATDTARGIAYVWHRDEAMLRNGNGLTKHVEQHHPPSASGVFGVPGQSGKHATVQAKRIPDHETQAVWSSRLRDGLQQMLSGFTRQEGVFLAALRRNNCLGESRPRPARRGLGTSNAYFCVRCPEIRRSSSTCCDRFYASTMLPSSTGRKKPIRSRTTAPGC
mmetsp:Transcript_101478/g.163654  ORF Transcript_101478/g.163654 Transcript_101478/m.163654 type:complete len:332 (-) Transcript_101478:136-1131(-)